MRGSGLITRVKAETNHANSTMSRIFITRFIVCAKFGPTFWFSKKNNSVDSRTFRSKFRFIKACYEFLRGIKKRFQIMGMLWNGLSHVCRDNQYVLCNTAVPESTFKNNRQSISWYLAREGAFRNE